MDGTRFRLDLKLQNLSMISIATKLWDSQDIKNRIKNNFSGLDREYPDENWCEISKLVVEHANSINLPAKLSVLLEKTIVLIGQKIYDWHFYVTKILRLDLIFTQKIYFTFGVIDEIKIFDLYWRNVLLPGSLIHRSDYVSHFSLLSLPCMYDRERFVKEQKNKMLDDLSQFYLEIEEGDEICNIMFVPTCTTIFKNRHGYLPPPRHMFEMCLEANFSKAARFYWKKLDEIEKVSNLTNFAKKCWRKDRVASFLMEKNCEILLFLINEMGEEERYSFFTDYAEEIIRLFLPVWPYQELIIDLLKYDWNIKSSRLRKMADFLIQFSLRIKILKLPLDSGLVFQIMEHAWGNIPVDEKLPFLRKNPRMISDFISTLNLDILNLLLNGSGITEVDGKEMGVFIKNGFLKLVKMGEFGFLNRIIETVFDFIPEPKELLKEHCYDRYFVHELIVIDESFGLMDQFLDWSAESEAERIGLKKKINAISLCRFLTEPRHKKFKFELADKFLNWWFETDGEVKNFKEEMKSSSFVIVGSGKYIRIKSGDLSWLSPGNSLAMHSDECPYDSTDGLTFLKIGDATELNPGAVLGIKSHEDDNFLRFRLITHVKITNVKHVGAKVGDFIVFTVREIWIDRRDRYFNSDKVVYSSNAFIKFYYETDEEVLKFKKTKLHVLVTKNLMEFLHGARYIYGHVPDNFLDEFCKFCMIPSEKIALLDKSVRRDVNSIGWIKFYEEH